MRGRPERQAVMLTTITPDQLVPEDHPIRPIKAMADAALHALSPTFAALYGHGGRPSVPPEHLLKASLLIALFSVRSERQFCEQLRYNLLFKWFLDLNVEDPPFHPTTFTKNRAQLLEHEVAQRFFAEVVAEAKRRHLLSADHFTVDGTLLDAWASMKSFRPKDGGGAPPSGKNPEVDFHGQKRSNATHASATDPEARLARKGWGDKARMAFHGHVVMENKNGLVVCAQVAEVTGTGEEDAALRLLDALGPRKRPRTVGGDKGYNTHVFVNGCRRLGFTPHVAAKHRWSVVDGRTTRHSGYGTSQRVRKRVEEIFGWMKTVGGCRKLRYIGVERNGWWFVMVAAAYNLVRMTKLPVAHQAPA